MPVNFDQLGTAYNIFFQNRSGFWEIFRESSRHLLFTGQQKRTFAAVYIAVKVSLLRTYPGELKRSRADEICRMASKAVGPVGLGPGFVARGPCSAACHVAVSGYRCHRAPFLGFRGRPSADRMQATPYYVFSLASASGYENRRSFREIGQKLAISP